MFVISLCSSRITINLAVSQRIHQSLSLTSTLFYSPNSFYRKQQNSDCWSTETSSSSNTKCQPTGQLCTRFVHRTYLYSGISNSTDTLIQLVYVGVELCASWYLWELIAATSYCNHRVQLFAGVTLHNLTCGIIWKCSLCGLVVNFYWDGSLVTSDSVKC